MSTTTHTLSQWLATLIEQKYIRSKEMNNFIEDSRKHERDRKHAWTVLLLGLFHNTAFTEIRICRGKQKLSYFVVAAAIVVALLSVKVHFRAELHNEAS